MTATRKRISKPTKTKGSLLALVAAAPIARSGGRNWLEELRDSSAAELPEILDILDDFFGPKKFTHRHSVASLMRFLSSLDCCNRKPETLRVLLDRLKSGEISTNDYR